MTRHPLYLGRPVRLFLFLAAAFAEGMLVEKAGYLLAPYAYAPPGLEKTFAHFWETWDLVDKHYVDRGAVSPRHMTQGAIAGLLASLADFGHTTHLTHEELEQMKGGLAGQFEGIGARLGIRKRQPLVVYTFPGSPAQAPGLRRADLLLEVNAKILSVLPLQPPPPPLPRPPPAPLHLP